MYWKDTLPQHAEPAYNPLPLSTERHDTAAAASQQEESVYTNLRGMLNQAAGTVAPVSKGLYDDLRNSVMDIDPNVSEAGVPSGEFRSELSKRDTSQEAETYLTSKLGQGGWGFDTNGNYMVTPQGMDALKLPHDGTPVRIDETSLTWYDVADWRGDAPALAGAVGVGLFTGGLSWLPSIFLVGAGGAIGKGIDELGDMLLGENQQSGVEVLKDIAWVGLESAAGEGIFRGILAPLGRKMMAPEAHRVSPEMYKLAEEARSIGVTPSAQQMHDAPIMGRIAAMLDNVLGNQLVAGNAKALTAELKRLASSAGKTADKYDTGASIKADIGAARRALSNWAEIITTHIDELTGNLPLIPTKDVSDYALEILKKIPKDQRTGKPMAAYSTPELLSTLDSLAYGFPKGATFNEWQQVVNGLFDAIGDQNLLPGMNSHHARELWKMATDAYKKAGEVDILPGLTAQAEGYQEIRAVIGTFRKQYHEKVGLFKSSLVKRLMRDESYGVEIVPEQVVNTIFKKGMQTTMNRVMRLMTPESKEGMRRLAMEDVLAAASSRTDDPLVHMFEGKKFLNALDSYGAPTLNAVFGKKMTAELYRFGRVASLVTKRQKMSGGIVAANIALHPWKNLPKIVQMRLLQKYFNSPTGIRHLTVGFKAPRTRAGMKALSQSIVQAQMLLDDHIKQTQTGETNGIR